MKVEFEHIGFSSAGEKIFLWTASNGEMQISVINYGCIITSILLPRGKARFSDVVLGLSNPMSYLDVKNPHFGAAVGLIANRVAKARFNLDGQTILLDANDGENSLHGGFYGLETSVFHAEPFASNGNCGIRFTKTILPYEQGLPASVDVEICYTLTGDNKVLLDYVATPSEKTPINLTNHSYFNLTGDFYQTIDDHILQMPCDGYLPVDKNLIPTGEIKNVEGTPFDFRVGKKIGRDIGDVPGGYDHTFVISNEKNPQPVECAYIKEEKSQRTLRVFTDLPGVQFYTGNFLDGRVGKRWQIHKARQGFCLETQFFPDSPNRDNFPNCFVEKGRQFKSRTIWEFGF